MQRTQLTAQPVHEHPSAEPRNFATFADDEQVVRATELAAIGAARGAVDRVRRCGIRDPRGRRFNCRDRSCPRCARRRANTHARKLAIALFELDQPILVVVAVRAEQDHLSSVLRHARCSLRQLRRRRVLRGARVAGAIEVAWSYKGWWVHAHLAIAPRVCVHKLDITWRQLVGAAGRVSMAPSPVPDDRRSLARYVTKACGWSPAPASALDLSQLSELRAATKGRQRLVLWGLGR